MAASAAQADPCEGRLPRPGTEFSGVVRYVGDGDSFCVGTTTEPPEWIEVRLADFYAPELKESDDRAAKQALTRLALGRTIHCTAYHRSYDRVVATCQLRGQDLGNLMRGRGVKEGGRGR